MTCKLIVLIKPVMVPKLVNKQPKHENVEKNGLDYVIVRVLYTLMLVVRYIENLFRNQHTLSVMPRNFPCLLVCCANHGKVVSE